MKEITACGMKYFVQIFVYSVLQHLPIKGTVTIDFNSIGYIEESIVLQCQHTPPINASSADWYRGGSLMDISSSRYNQTPTPTGFNLTISSLVPYDAGVYRCGIAFGTSAIKSLTIYYNTKNVTIAKLGQNGIEISFVAFPNPVFVATVIEDGVNLDVNWNETWNVQGSGVVKVSLQNSTVCTNKNKVYAVCVKITHPLSLDVDQNITWNSDQTTESIDDSANEVIIIVPTLFCTIIFIIISIVILVKRGAMDPKIRRLKTALGFKKSSASENRKDKLGTGQNSDGSECVDEELKKLNGQTIA